MREYLDLRKSLQKRLLEAPVVTTADTEVGDILMTRLDNIYSELCVVVHGRKIVTKPNALSAFRETLAVVELLYEHNGL